MSADTERLPEQEDLLLDLAKRLAYHKQGRSAVCIHTSMLRPEIKTTQDVNLAARKARDLAYRYQGEVFHLSNDDLVFIMKDAKEGLVKDILDQICHIFRHDPLVKSKRDRFITRYVMDDQYQEFLDFAKITRHQASTQGEDGTARPFDVDLEDPGLIQTPTGAVDPEEIVQKSQIYMFGNSDLEPRACKVFLPDDSHIEGLMDGIDIESNMELRSFALEFGERNVLVVAPHLAAPWPAPWAMKTKVATLLSSEFLTFDRDWKAAADPEDPQRPSFIIAYRDIQADRTLFQFARDFVTERGYDLWLDGVTKDQLPTIDLDSLGVSMICLESLGTREELGLTRKILKMAVGHIGGERVVLGQCELEGSLDLARELGIACVSGSYADAVFAGTKSWKAA